MLRPSYNDLINAINSTSEEEGEHPVINSRYGIVIATAKRARQIIAGADVLIDDAEGKKPLSIAIEEIDHNKVHLVPEGEEPETEAKTAAAENAEAPAAEEAEADAQETVPVTEEASAETDEAAAEEETEPETPAEDEV